MVEPENNSSGNRSYQSLLLRVRRPGGHSDEIYLAEGLTIGRSQANTIQLADEPAVARSHARVSFAGDGIPRLICLDNEANIATAGTTVHELLLRPGTTFQIGQNFFECVPGLRMPFREAASLEPSCPFCGHKQSDLPPDGPIACAGCQQPLYVLADGTAFRRRTVIPAQFGPYRVEHFVARGGMGLVLKGFDERRTAPVAIKLLLPTKGVGTTAAERFKQEIMLLKSVRHPNVVRLLDYGRVARVNYLILDWVAGPSLRETILELRDGKRQLPFDQALRWLEQVCKGLAALHAVGIVHRDLKPSNILIAPTGEALISDLGIAKHVDQDTALTATGEIPGTIEYMAPEQLSAPDTVDQRTDLYSLGVAWYELLTDRRPIGTWLPACQINSTVPTAFDQILAKLLAQQPQHRFTDVHDLLVALSILRSDQGSSHPNVQRPVKPSPVIENENSSTGCLIPPISHSGATRLGQLVYRHPRSTILAAIIVSTLALAGIGTAGIGIMEWFITTIIIIPICGIILCLNWLIVEWRPRDKVRVVGQIDADLASKTAEEQRSEYEALTRNRKSNNRQSIVTGLCGLILVLTGSQLGAGSLLRDLCSVVGIILFCFGGGFYAKYKGHSPAWGLLCGLLCVLSLFLLAILPDRNRWRLAKLEAVLGPISQARQEKPVQTVRTSLRSSLLSASGAAVIVTSLLLSWGLFCAFSPSAATLSSADGRFRITLPAGWHENREILSQAPGVQIAASDLVDTAFIVLAADRKTDFADMSLERYAELRRDVLVKDLANSQVTAITTGAQKGRRVLQFEAHVTVENYNYAYLVTVFDTDQDYCGVTACTLASQFARDRNELRQVALSAVPP